MNSLELKLPPPLVCLIAVVLMLILQDFYPLSLLDSLIGRVLAGALALLGMALAVAGVVAFRQSATTIDPRTPDKARCLVTHGVYRFTRNPMYLGMMLLLAALACWLAELTAFLVLALTVRYLGRYQIQPEERILLEKFGESYQAYLERVGRWL